jgi:hypothetical protein
MAALAEYKHAWQKIAPIFSMSAVHS